MLIADNAVYILILYLFSHSLINVGQHFLLLTIYKLHHYSVTEVEYITCNFKELISNTQSALTGTL